MTYFTGRPRAYSKPTREEIKGLNMHLMDCSADELRHIVLSAAGQSSDAAHLFTKILKEVNPSLLSPQGQVSQTHDYTFLDLDRPSNGLLTPVDLSEDSEMSGTENSQPSHSTYRFGHPESFSTRPSTFPLISTSLEIPSQPLQPRSNKRKTLADRDDNIPTPQAHPNPSTSKRRKPSRHNLAFNTTDRHPDEDQCLNCGFWISHSKFNHLHDCIYHPGHLENNNEWSCCRSTGSQLRGCLITRHRGPNRDHPGLLTPSLPSNSH